MSKVRNVVWNIVTAVSVLILLSLAGSKLLTGWSSVFSYRVFYIMSESMEPEIGVHDLVIGEHVPEDEQLEIGDVYVYKRKGTLGTELIIHRLIAVTEEGKYQFKGDNNELPDAEPVEREKIGYRVIG